MNPHSFSSAYTQPRGACAEYSVISSVASVGTRLITVLCGELPVPVAKRSRSVSGERWDPRFLGPGLILETPGANSGSASWRSRTRPVKADQLSCISSPR